MLLIRLPLDFQTFTFLGGGTQLCNHPSAKVERITNIPIQLQERWLILSANVNTNRKFSRTNRPRMLVLAVPSSHITYKYSSAQHGHII